MRELNTIVLHCSATEAGRPYSAATIRKWHTLPPPNGRGWSDIGYHYVIGVNGELEMGRPLDRAGAHVKGHNATTIGVCYVGGLEDGKPADTMNAAQVHTFLALVNALRIAFGYMDVAGHNDFTDLKTCPNFKVGVKFGQLNK
jgi:N-acetylmuramoyl-L-alanine amidase